MRKDKEKFIKQQCLKIEKNAVNSSTKELYQGIKNLTKSFKPSADTIKSEDGTVLCDGDKIKERCKEYCYKLYKKDDNFQPIHLDLMVSEPEPPPRSDEVKEAIKDLKNYKSPGGDEITTEVIKNGGPNIKAFYHKLCCKVWNDQK